MKDQLILLLTVFLALTACSRNKNKIAYEYELPPDSDAVAQEIIPMEIHIQDSLDIRESLGEVIEHEYQGLLPAADGPGIDYDLVLWNQEKAEDGVFWLSTTYKGSGDETDHTFITQGKWSTLHRTHQGNSETIYQLNPMDGTSPIYFLEDGENLTLLNQERERISSITNHNYTLSRKK